MTTPNGLGSFSRDPDEAQARVDEWAQGFARKAQRYQAAQAEAEQIRLTASNGDGSVRVTVRADGSVTDLEFANKARTMPLPELSAQILTTMRRAQADIAGRVGEVMAEQLGDEDLETRTVMLDSLRSRFPDPDAEDEPAPEPPAAEPPATPEPGGQARPSDAGPSGAAKNPTNTEDSEDEDNNPW
ncbi:YbaB/EbfC family nucleoid-associated protein [Amycolatopsis nigrescens]|uniref:YbaB/EbfC family nucleoid-associated protein n=1 Tax=Amycolatopsis nigrescens TaxID=381445 RepID=UPI00037D2A82|nr:YbaB/EbfC family nucleoid-associated protein [Amycolatopsis nigrescens]